MTPDRLNLNGVDLSGYVSNTEMAHGHDNKSAWRDELISGPAQASFAVTGSWDTDTGRMLAELFATTQTERAVIVQTPDGWWQRCKDRLPRWRILAWIKVRYLTYTTRGVLIPGPAEGDFTVQASTPVTVTTITRRRGGR